MSVNEATLLSLQTNALYSAAFEEWASNLSNVKILSDQTTSNEVNKKRQSNYLTFGGPQRQVSTVCLLQGRLGAVACLQLAVKHFNIQDHVVVVGG